MGYIVCIGYDVITVLTKLKFCFKWANKRNSSAWTTIVNYVLETSREDDMNAFWSEPKTKHMTSA